MKQPDNIKRVVSHPRAFGGHGGASVAPAYSHIVLYLTPRSKKALCLPAVACLAFAELEDGRWALIEEPGARERKIHAKHQAIQFYGIYMTGKDNVRAEIIDGIAYWPAGTFTTERPQRIPKS